ncbi:Hypothetical protein MVR_LOCUS74 [uncultured virus]|nr:Hypothetical protein MVR_LOCUS74 [uncultured virus]
MPNPTRPSGRLSAAERRLFHGDPDSDTSDDEIPANETSSSETSANETSGSETNVRICESSYMPCAGNETGKNTMPAGDNRKMCRACRAYINEQIRQRRAARKAYDLRLQQENPGMYTCIYCPAGTLYQEEDMGLNEDGKRSAYCETHYARQKAAAAKPAYRARKRATDTTPKMRALRRQWCQDNPDKMKRRYEAHRAKPERAFKSYQKKCTKIGRVFELTLEQFAELVTASCYYCNDPYTKLIKSVDRIDSQLGYTIDNVVTACIKCNVMKNTLNEPTFVLMCTQISIYMRLGRIGPYADIFNDYIGTMYNQYKHNAVKDDRVFEISADIYDRMRHIDPCYVCGREPTPTHSNGLDRIDSDLGYTLSNTLSCCADCNYLKHNFRLDYFIVRCGNIEQIHEHRLGELRARWTPSGFATKRIKPSVEELETPVTRPTPDDIAEDTSSDDITEDTSSDDITEDTSSEDPDLRVVISVQESTSVSIKRTKSKTTKPKEPIESDLSESYEIDAHSKPKSKRSPKLKTASKSEPKTVHRRSKTSKLATGSS